MIATDTGPRHSQRIGAVIPYFQREPGLLRRALSSVAQQEHLPAQVVVVDDGSPRAAEEEITPSLRDALPGLTVVHQANRGISAARNAALDALTEDVSAIALLDSDDYWEPSHLRKAAAALSLGADFFFSNFGIEGVTANAFHEHPRGTLLHGSQPVDAATGILRWSESISTLFSAGGPFGTSTVVFRRAVKPDLRFSQKFRRACEDQAAFWELMVRSAWIAFSIEPTAVYGSKGLGTWRNATLGSVKQLERLADEIRLRRHVMSSYPVSPDDRHLMRRAIAERRHVALYSTLHLLRRGHNVFNEVLYLFRSDPLCAASWCVNLPKLVYRHYHARPSGAR